MCLPGFMYIYGCWLNPLPEIICISACMLKIGLVSFVLNLSRLIIYSLSALWSSVSRMLFRAFFMSIWEMILNRLPDGGLVITKILFSIYFPLLLCGQCGFIGMNCVFMEKAGLAWTQSGTK
jgi:hypothetical protein